MAYPLIGAGSNVVTQYPYSETDEHVVSRADLDCGISVTRYENSSVMRRFVITYVQITKAELATIENFFDAMRGPLGEFQFTDDQGGVWNTTRFNMDRIEPTYPQPGQYSLVVELIAVP